MEPAAHLITAIAALISALIWPLALLLLFIIFRHEIRAASAKIPKIVDRVQKIKFGGLEAELEKVAETTLQVDSKAAR